MASEARRFLDALRRVVHGGRGYRVWLGVLCAIIALGAWAYSIQLREGLAVTNMRNQVAWGFYISNFTFLVGVAAAAVLLVIPAYVYNFKPIKEIAILGEMMAVTAIIMCILFVTVDVGGPARLWHLAPVIGRPNFPISLLTWDILVLNGYLVINGTVFLYVLYSVAHGRSYKKVLPLILLSIPWAVGIHTVTAFLYNGLVARPFWNASILAPRFLASAFCSGPALMILVLQLVRKEFRIVIDNRALFKIAELVAYALAFNLFLLGAEAFKEFYGRSAHMAPMEYLYLGLHGHRALVPFMWTALGLNLTAFVLFLLPRTRTNLRTLNVGCAAILAGVYIEKGLGLVVPGFTPDTLGEIYEYVPSQIELAVSAGIWASGALIYTLLAKFSVPIFVEAKHFVVGDRHDEPHEIDEHEEHEEAPDAVAAEEE
ncbi:MAG: polysulfide reductase NrfD [Deltaproteobacteria bacterium]|nr:polysulfide reductase NrfD [Deltaproteobacteria bacterium]